MLSLMYLLLACSDVKDAHDHDHDHEHEREREHEHERKRKREGKRERPRKRRKSNITGYHIYHINIEQSRMRK